MKMDTYWYMQGDSSDSSPFLGIPLTFFFVRLHGWAGPTLAIKAHPSVRLLLLLPFRRRRRRLIHARLKGWEREKGGGGDWIILNGFDGGLQKAARQCQ